VQRLEHITQPVISWNQTSPGAGGASLTLSQPEPSPTGGASPSSGVASTARLSSPGPGSFSAAVPTSYTHIGQSSPSGGTSPVVVNTNGGVTDPASSSSATTPKSVTLSTEWTAPPVAVQPPKFIYPNRPFSSSSSHPPSSSIVAPSPASPSQRTTDSVASPSVFSSVLPPSVGAGASRPSTTTDGASGGGGQRDQIKRLEFNHVQAGPVVTPPPTVSFQPLSPPAEFSPQPYPVEVSCRD
jgi:hypothetical protein